MAYDEQADGSGGPSAAGRYENLLTYRNPYQKAAYESASLTIPALFPRESDSRNRSDRDRESLRVPAQSLGARGVNNLAAKMLMALVPPNSPLFRYVIDAGVKGGADGDGLNAVNELLSERESVIMADIESSKYRPKLIEAFKQLIVSGNVLLLLQDRELRVFRVDRYVVKRSPMGGVSEIVVKETLDRSNLPPRVRKAVESKDYSSPDDSDHRDDTVELYTWIRRRGNKFVEHQECGGSIVPGSKGSFPSDSPRWLPLTFVRVDGEDYGRGMVEEFIGDLTTYNALQKAIREDAAIASHTVFMVDPNSPPSLERTLTNAPNGGYVRADLGSVQAHRTDKQGDMQIAWRSSEQLKQDLSFAFLLNSAVQRQAERVTAVEIREMARELETTQAGLFSVMAEELIMPVVVAHERDLERAGKIAPLPPEMVRPAIVTGLDALGRSGDLIRLQGVLGDVGALSQLDPSAPQYLETASILEAIFQGHSVVTEGKLKPRQQVAAEMQAAKQEAQTQKITEMVGDAAPEIVKGAMPGLVGPN